MIDLPYHPYFCEENAWHVCRTLDGHGYRPESLNMVFTFSTGRCVPMRQQRSGGEGAIVCWDYHAFVIEGERSGARVWDVESLLGYPVSLPIYLERSFLARDRPEFVPLFRVIPWRRARFEFSSDRRHMRDGDSYLQPPPPWPIIGAGHRLPDCIDPEPTAFGGCTDAEELLSRFV